MSFAATLTLPPAGGRTAGGRSAMAGRAAPAAAAGSRTAVAAVAGGRATGRDMGGGPTLGEHIAGVWEVLAARDAAPCPICETGTLQPVYGAHARPVMGRCRACGSELA